MLAIANKELKSADLFADSNLQNLVYSRQSEKGKNILSTANHKDDLLYSQLAIKTENQMVFVKKKRFDELFSGIYFGMCTVLRSRTPHGTKV